MSTGTTSELARFDPALPCERAWTAPASWYADPAFFELERERVFRQGWMAVARSDELSAPGSYVAGELFGSPWVIVRDESGELRGFHNVCRHHATAVMKGSGSCGELVCPYHGWTYELDGRLRSAPQLGRVEEFVREEHGLKPLRVASWGPLVFVHLGQPTSSPGDQLTALSRELDELGSGELRFVERRRYELDCNWKVYVDNYLDGGYHVPHLHGGLDSSLEMAQYEHELCERYNVQRCPGGRDQRVGAGALYAWLYPNLMLNRYGQMLDVNRVLPLTPTRTAVEFEWYAAPELDQATLARWLEDSDRVQREDEDVCASVQRGLASGAYDRGRYAEREAPMHHFHCLLHADLTRSRA